MQKNRRIKAFTLVEIMVVVLIIAMLAAFVAPKVFKKFGKAQANISIAEIGKLSMALEDFAIACGRYPSSEEGLAVMVSVEGPEDLAEGKWDGPYIKEKQLNDPWGNPYIYIAEGQLNVGSFDIISFGPDGSEGTEDDIFNE